MKTHHVKLHYVLPAEDRDEWNRVPDAIKATWRNALLGEEQIDAVGEVGNYVIELTKDLVEQVRSAKNVAYVEEAIEARIQQIGEVEPAMFADAETDQAFPDPAMMKYHNAEGTETPEIGAGYGLFILDTGASKNAESQTTGGIKGRTNYTGSGSSTDTTDRQGHGSMTLNLAAVGKVWAWVMKVLGDNGSGSSTGIIAAIRGAAKFVRDNPQYKGKIILSGSLGGPPGQKLQAYTDACADAEAAGVLCLWSAGNDGRNAVGAPGNWKEKRASIAFTLSDSRASFSNYASWAALASQGERTLVIRADGTLGYANGTSFSLPLLVRHIFVVASTAETDVFTAFQAILDTARDTPEPFAEEASGGISARSAIAKLSKTPEKKPPAYYPNLSRMTKSKFDGTALKDMEDVVLTGYGVERGVYLKKRS